MGKCLKWHFVFTLVPLIPLCAQWTDTGAVSYTGDKIGIGTSSPYWDLEVDGGIGGAHLEIDGTGSYIGSNLYWKSGEGWKYRSTNSGWVIRHGTGGDFQFFTSPSGTAGTVATLAERMRIQQGGNVGIGVSSPLAYLDVYGSSSSTNSLLLRSGNTNLGSSSSQIRMGYSGSPNYSHSIRTRHHGGQDARNAIDFFVWDYGVDSAETIGSKHVLTIDGNGNGMVGIGTKEPQNELDVDGTIRAEEVIVETFTGADFVFEPDYPLKPLNKIEAYVAENGHLPGIPPAREMIDQGVSIGELQILLLQKVEELTLYVIQLENRIQELETK